MALRTKLESSRKPEPETSATSTGTGDPENLIVLDEIADPENKTKAEKDSEWIIEHCATGSALNYVQKAVEEIRHGATPPAPDVKGAGSEGGAGDLGWKKMVRKTFDSIELKPGWGGFSIDLKSLFRRKKPPS